MFRQVQMGLCSTIALFLCSTITSGAGAAIDVTFETVTTTVLDPTPVVSYITKEMMTTSSSNTATGIYAWSPELKSIVEESEIIGREIDIELAKIEVEDYIGNFNIPTDLNDTTIYYDIESVEQLSEIYQKLGVFDAGPLVERLGLQFTATVSPNTESYPTSAVVNSAEPLNNKTEALKFVTSFWDAFMNPDDKTQATKIFSPFFTEDSKGRITVTRDFKGSELNTEYIFGLFSDINTVLFRMIGVPKVAELQNFLFDDNKVVSTVTAEFLAEPYNFTIPVQIDMFMLLDGSNGESYSIAEYDASFRNFERIYEITGAYTIAQLEKEFNETTTLTGEEIFYDLAIESICLQHEAYCLGPNRQYSNMEQCLQFLHTVRLGESYEGGRNTIFCRNIHQIMLPFRPSVHCPHIGPTGGGMCVDSDTYYYDVVGSYDEYFSTLFYSP